MANTNDPISTWQDTVEKNAQIEQDNYQESHDDVSEVLEKNRQDVKRQQDNQNQEVSDYIADHSSTK